MEESPKKKSFFSSNYFYFLIGLILGTIILIIFGLTSSNRQDPSADKSAGNPYNYRITTPDVPGNLSFAGDEVPLKNFEVKERIERELIVNMYWHSFTILGIERANRWFPVIEPILKEYGIPDDFKYLPVAESDLTNAVSPAGAVGFWQITEEIARKYGLEVNDQVDERYDVEKSTDAACRYLLDAYNQFKNWTLAAASYNMGTNGMAKQIQRQKANNYYNLVLSDETSRYIARVIAIKEIFEHPEKYGYYISKDDLYPVLKTNEIKVSGAVNNWADFAIEHEINYKILKYYNPWLRDISLDNKHKKNYYIKIPVKGSIYIIGDQETN